MTALNEMPTLTLEELMSGDRWLYWLMRLKLESRIVTLLETRSGSKNYIALLLTQYGFVAVWNEENSPETNLHRLASPEKVRLFIELAEQSESKIVDEIIKGVMKIPE